MTTHSPALFPSRFAGRTVLITGAGTGMGKAAALRFGRGGANVVLAGRRAAELDAVAATIENDGGRALAIPTDVTDADAVRKMVERSVATFGALHMAWNNAGMLGALQPIVDMESEDFDAVMATNFRGAALCVKHELRAMLAAGVAGAIVNTSSWTAQGALPGTSAYAASKGALDAMMRAVAMEVGSRNIRINNVSPGVIATPMAEAALGDERAMRPFLSHTPLRRIGQPEDIADVVLWLLSDDARFVTGQSLLVDGGFTLGGLRPWLNELVAEHA
ncbi:SDR family NAD(P)-dependent oxidoreductase [Paraburkholderia sp. BL21I4N1]|uniref:SDR family NAD(P)-dependent oxidoreductase n=1 Tax=Paraburkholderia sp. BL21I4N1 TaxID=1938801 RepID=UPI000CFB58A3|nr:glucose 1-dehydrogenase [Paraburkholderia sp. BL21I4N1]PQV54661.1 NAD(P)-dependent dehydrogenase (short-subunit alcohol dehydrogenase family) [Paraburkholderia sp. BL21I4N1]